MQCLVTKLKESVNDDSLRKIDELRFTVNSVENPDYGTTGGQRLGFESNVAQILTCLGDGSFTDGAGTPSGQTKGVSANVRATLVCKNGDYQVSIPKKSAITYMKMFSSLSLDIEELDGCSALTYLECSNANTTGDLEFISSTNIASLYIGGTKVYGDIKNIPLSVSAVGLNYTNVSGSIENLGSHTDLTTLSVASTEVEGSVEVLAQKQSATRTSGTLKITTVGAKITLNGIITSSLVTITFTQDGYTIS